MKILGIHGGVTQLQHEPSAALVVDGQIIAACEEERFVRKKNASGLTPIESIAACLREAKLSIQDIDVLVHPGDTAKDLKARIENYMDHYFGHVPPVQLVNHQQAHMASAYFCSPFDEAICLSFDGYGDELSSAQGYAKDGKMHILRTTGMQESLGRFFSAMTSYLGFEVAEAEYKVMGLAAYGKPNVDLSPIIKIDGTNITINDDYFRGSDRVRAAGKSGQVQPPLRSFFEPWYTPDLVELLGPPRRKGQPLSQFHIDLSASIQKTFEEAVLAMVEWLYQETKIPYVTLAGGCALNCKANGLVRALPHIKGVFVQPAASDRGLSLGAAVLHASQHDKINRGLDHVYLGPTYSKQQMLDTLKVTGAKYIEVENASVEAARRLAAGQIIGWFQGRSEFGPRALGNRSILADPSRPNMKDEINKRVKFREEFRPFAPAVLEERASEIFNISNPSPFMTVATTVRPEWSQRLPAVTHVDNTARVQTVNAKTNPAFHQLIEEFGRLSGVPVVLNTSFNVRGEPIVETPQNAIATFASSGLDSLFIGNFVLTK